MLNTSQSADSQLMKPQNPLIFQESKPQNQQQWYRKKYIEVVTCEWLRFWSRKQNQIKSSEGRTLETLESDLGLGFGERKTWI